MAKVQSTLKPSRVSVDKIIAAHNRSIIAQIEALKEQHSCTNLDLEMVTGMSQHTISNLLAGKRSMTIEQVARFSYAFNTDII